MLFEHSDFNNDSMGSSRQSCVAERIEKHEDVSVKEAVLFKRCVRRYGIPHRSATNHLMTAAASRVPPFQPSSPPLLGTQI